MEHDRRIVGLALGLLVLAMTPRPARADTAFQVGAGAGIVTRYRNLNELVPSFAGDVRLRLWPPLAVEFEVSRLSYGFEGNVTAYVKSPSLVLIAPAGRLEIAVGIGPSWHEVEFRGTTGQGRGSLVAHHSENTEGVLGEIGWSARHRWAPFAGVRLDLGNRLDTFYFQKRYYAGVRFNPFK